MAAPKWLWTRVKPAVHHYQLVSNPNVELQVGLYSDERLQRVKAMFEEFKAAVLRT